jgi:hypothetical protein
MCRSCVEIDKQIKDYRELLRSTRDQKEIERISRMIAKLYGDRVLPASEPGTVRPSHLAALTAGPATARPALRLALSYGALCRGMPQRTNPSLCTEFS